MDDDEASGISEVGASSNSESSNESSSESNGESSSSSSSDEFDGPEGDEATDEPHPLTDMPNELPVGCIPLEFHDDQSQGTGAWSGWIRCQGADFRLQAIDCPIAFPYEPCDTCDGCNDDEQCLDVFPFGYCTCTHNCTRDADCGNNEICACRAGPTVPGPDAGPLNWYNNTCVPADCAGESDCPAIPDLQVPHCRLSRDICGGAEGVHCRTDADACTFDDDCSGQYCRYDSGDERWSCESPAICE